MGELGARRHGGETLGHVLAQLIDGGPKGRGLAKSRDHVVEVLEVAQDDAPLQAGRPGQDVEGEAVEALLGEQVAQGFQDVLAHRARLAYGDDLDAGHGFMARAWPV